MGRVHRTRTSAARMCCCARLNQLSAALALIELDGVAARIVICPPDVKPEHLPSLIERAAVTVVVSDDPALAVGGRFAPVTLPHKPGDGELPPASQDRMGVCSHPAPPACPRWWRTRWKALTGANPARCAPMGVVWGTFYDIRRYGGLQILLRALLGQASLILSDATEDVADFLARLGRHGVTHLTGTPSHWRRALMSPANAAIAPATCACRARSPTRRFWTASRRAFPAPPVGHAYASTEAGVGFEVTDGLEGFPAAFLDRHLTVRWK